MADDVRPTREALLEAIASEHARLLGVIRRAEAAGRLAEPGAVGEWSPRDVFAHVVFYQRWIAIQLGAPLALGVERSAELARDLDARNAYVHAALRDRSMADLRRDDEEAYTAVRERVAGLTEPDLDGLWEVVDTTARPVADGSAGEAWPLWQWVRGDTCGHYEEHTVELESWLATGATA